MEKLVNTVNILIKPINKTGGCATSQPNHKPINGVGFGLVFKQRYRKMLYV